MEIEQIPARIDSLELAKIKNQFALRDRINADSYESNQLTRRNPRVSSVRTSQPEPLSSATLRGLSYPLEVDGAGGLKLSSSYDRIGQQILEVLQTRVGERVFRPFFGLPEVLFETVDEYSLARTIQTQLEASLTFVPELSVNVSIDEEGRVQVRVFYSVEGLGTQIINYSFT